VRAYIAHLRTTTADGSAPRSRKERAAAVSPRALRWLLSRKRDDLEKARPDKARSTLAPLARGTSCLCPAAGLSLDGA